MINLICYDAAMRVKERYRETEGHFLFLMMAMIIFVWSLF